MNNSLPRFILNLFNAVSEIAGVRILSLAEHRYLLNEPVKRYLSIHSEFIALAGTLTAFTRYLSFRCEAEELVNLSGSTEEYLQHPETLANRVRGIAERYQNPIDRFMVYYADHFRDCNSQWSQDIFVSYVLKEKKAGTFLELGGADGITHSNSLSLETRYSWSGTLVEPHPSQFQLLKNTRQNIRNRLLNCAISITNERGTVQLSDNGQLSAIQGYDSRDLHAGIRSQSADVFTVGCIPFKDVFDVYDEIDYLSLDVEGPEIELLTHVDWSKAPAVITVEHNWRRDVISGLRDLLVKKGYKEAFREHGWLTRGDLWFVQPSRDVVDIDTCGSTG